MNIKNRVWQMISNWLVNPSEYMSHRQIQKKLAMEWYRVSLGAISNYRKKLMKWADEFWRRFESMKHVKPIVNAIDDTWILYNEIEDNFLKWFWWKNLETKIDFKKESWELSVSKNNRIKSLDDLIIHCDIDLNVWEIERHIINKWEVWAKDEESWKIITEPLYQVKAWIKKRKDISQWQMDTATLERLSTLWLEYCERNMKDTNMYSSWNKLLEVCIFDAHINKLCIAEKSWTEWNHKIAKEAYLDMVSMMVERGKKEWCNRVCFIVGNDFFQTDTLQQTTTKWTRVDASTLLYPAFTLWQEIIIEAVTMLSELGNVDIIMVWGNHDKASAFYLWQVLSAWYRWVQSVNVDNSMKSRKYYKFWRNMIMFAHWDSEKLKDLNSIMAVEQPHMWANAWFREVHLWHYHTQQVYEQHGVIVRYMNSISWTDSWHEENWYVWNVRWWTAFVWSLNDWITWQFTFNI